MTGQADGTPPWQVALQTLEHGLLQRDVAARTLLLAALAGEHLLLIGPPGTAKSELARRLQQLMPGAHYFERLLTRFTVPEELFGPLSLRALEDDRYERLTEGYLPQAEVAFLDEVFKANSAILNTLLGLLHERRFDNGVQRIAVPLVCLVGASNELPEDDSLLAFYDRFLLRVPVAPVDDAHFAALLQPVTQAPAQAHLLNAQTLADVQHRAASVTLTPEVLALLTQARQRCRETGQPVSDRRWRQLAHLLQVEAASLGRDQVDPWDTWVLPFVLAHGPEQVPGWTDWFMEQVALAVPLEVEGLDKAVRAFEGQLEIEERAPAEEPDTEAGKLALAQAMAEPGGQATPMIRMMSERARRRYTPLHIQTRLAQVDECLRPFQSLHDSVHQQAAQTLSQARHHTWFPPSWREHIEEAHARRCDAATDLLQRLLRVRAGFAALPHGA